MVTSYDADTSQDRAYSADGRKYGKRARQPDINYPRLFTAMRTAKKSLEKFRKERYAAVQQYVGAHYAEGGSQLVIPVNVIAKYIDVVSRYLVPKCPRAMLSTQSRANQPAVSAMQDWINMRLPEMYFDSTLHKWVVNALFCIGVMKVALGTPEDAAMSAYISPAGQPFAENIELDDFVCDFGSRDINRLSFAGHKYRLPLEIAENVDYFDKAERKLLEGSVTSGDYQLNDDGDERIEQIGRAMTGADRDFEPMVDLYEIYIPRLRRICTFRCGAGGQIPTDDTKPLRVQEWLGPNCGPYHYLSFHPVPGNLMPKAPISDQVDLAEAINDIYRKNIAQSLRQKTILPVRGAAVDDAKNVKQVGDGEILQCENAEGLKEVSLGGPSPVILQHGVHLRDVHNNLAGNLDVLSGGAPQSDTATQDKLLNANASGGVTDKAQTVIAGSSRVLESMCWFWWYHPELVMKTQKTLPGLENIGIERKLYPGIYQEEPGENVMKRQGRFEDLQCKVDPYSLVFKTPQQRAQTLLMYFDKFAPLAPILAQQGIQIDMQFLIRQLAKYSDEPDLVNLFTIAEPPPQQPGQGGGNQGGMKPASTTREYTRQSKGQDTEASRLADMENMASQFGSEGGEE